MKVKLILPALTEARSPFYRSVKYSLFPPLGLATLAGYLDPEDEVELVDEHVQPLRPDDEPDLVAIEVYITSAHRAYEIADHYRARGVHVCLGGLHVTSLPEEAAQHADTIFLGPGEDTWPAFLRDFRRGRRQRACTEWTAGGVRVPALQNGTVGGVRVPALQNGTVGGVRVPALQNGPVVYRSTRRTLHGQPRPRRDLIQRHLYLVPNSLVVSRGCPHACDFCYKTSFFAGGSSFYTQQVDDALREIADLPGRHLYFLDDNLFGDPRFARELFAGMAGMGRVWQAGGTVQAIFAPGLMAEAARAGLRSLFVGFETLSEAGLRSQNKHHNVHRDYGLAVRKLRDLGVMVNASFVFGMDGDDDTVFDRTVEWAVAHGIETATFHILTPYPGTALHRRLVAEGRITSEDWSRYDTRHVVYEPRGMSAEALEQGYWQAYRDFYRWSNIWQGALAKETWAGRARHLALAGGWKKMEPVWDVIIRTGQLQRMRPWLEGLLAVGKKARAVSGPVAPVRVTPVNAGGDPRRNGGGPEPT